MKFAIQALMSSFTPTTGIKHKEPDTLDHSGPVCQLYRLNLGGKKMQKTWQRITGGPEDLMCGLCAHVCVYMSDGEGEADETRSSDLLIRAYQRVSHRTWRHE